MVLKWDLYSTDDSYRLKNVRGARLFGRPTKSQNYLKGTKWRLNLMQLFVWKIHNFIYREPFKNYLADFVR